MSAVKNEKTGGNQRYLKDWDEYSDSVADKRQTLLLPITFGFNSKGGIIRERMTAPDVKALYAKGRKDIPKDMFKYPDLLPNPDDVVKHYLKHFNNDKNENFTKPTPLDIRVKRPVLLLFGFYHDKWRFTEKAAYRMHNDAQDHTQNYYKVATLHARRGLMLHNRHYSDPAGMKLDLCVDVNQTIRRRKYTTPIIIDPGLGNAQSGFPG